MFILRSSAEVNNCDTRQLHGGSAGDNHFS